MARTLPAGVARGDDDVARCWWPGDDPLYRRYHDREWGRPVRRDHRLFEKLCLEGFQAGLSWITILRKRQSFRAAFADFDPAEVAQLTARDVVRLMNDASIVRNRAKILATINNARRYLELVDETRTLAAYARQFTPATRRARLDLATLHTLTSTAESVALSNDLRRRGWAFVGPTTVYAFMQAVGIVNDHLDGCAMREEVERLGQRP